MPIPQPIRVNNNALRSHPNVEYVGRCDYASLSSLLQQDIGTMGGQVEVKSLDCTVDTHIGAGAAKIFASIPTEGASFMQIVKNLPIELAESVEKLISSLVDKGILVKTLHNYSPSEAAKTAKYSLERFVN